MSDIPEGYEAVTDPKELAAYKAAIASKIPEGYEKVTDPDILKLINSPEGIPSQLGHAAEGGFLKSIGNVLQNIRPSIPSPDVNSQRTLEQIQKRNPSPLENPLQKQISNVTKGVSPTWYNSLASGLGESALGGAFPGVGEAMPALEGANLLSRLGRYGYNAIRQVPGQMAYGSLQNTNPLKGAAEYGIGTVLSAPIHAAGAEAIRAAKIPFKAAYNLLFPNKLELPEKPIIEKPDKASKYEPPIDLEKENQKIDLNPLLNNTMGHLSQGMSQTESRAKAGQMIYQQAQKNEADQTNALNPIFNNTSFSFRPGFKKPVVESPLTAQEALTGNRNIPKSEEGTISSSYIENKKSLKDVPVDSREFHDKFLQDRSLNTLNSLRKAYGNAIGEIKAKKWEPGSGGLTDIDKLKLKKYSKSYDQLTNDTGNFIDTIDPNLRTIWDKSKEDYMNNSVPYYAIRQIKDIAKGKVVNPDSGFSQNFIRGTNDPYTRKIAQDLGPEFNIHLIRDALGTNLKTKDLKNLPDKLQNIYNKGFDRFGDTHLENLSNKIQESNEENDSIDYLNKDIKNRNLKRIYMHNKALSKYYEKLNDLKQKEYKDELIRVNKQNQRRLDNAKLSKIMGAVGGASLFGGSILSGLPIEGALGLVSGLAPLALSRERLNALTNSPKFQKTANIGNLVKKYVSKGSSSVVNPLSRSSYIANQNNTNNQ